MLRWNPRDIWLNPAAAFRPKQHWTPGEELCWAWLTAQHPLLVLPVIHMRLILGMIPAHRETNNTRSVLCTIRVWILVLPCCALIPRSATCATASTGQVGRGITAHLQGCAQLSLAELAAWLPEKSLQSSPECTKPHFSHLLFRGFMVFSSSAWWPESFWRQTGLHPFLILCCYDVFLSGYSEYSPTPVTHSISTLDHCLQLWSIWRLLSAQLLHLLKFLTFLLH